jgi:isopentenyldiphosphate isomerase
LIVGNGVSEAIPFKANPEEVQDTRWVSLADLQAILRNQPDTLTPWFRLISQKLLFSEPYNLWNVIANGSNFNALGDQLIDLNKL